MRKRASANPAATDPPTNRTGCARASCVAEFDELVDVAVREIVRKPVDLPCSGVDRLRDGRRLTVEFFRSAVDGAGETSEGIDAARLLEFAGLAEFVPGVLRKLSGLLPNGVGRSSCSVPQFGGKRPHALT